MCSLNSSNCEGILIISCDQLPPENVILQILGVETLPDAACHLNVKGYPWSFETKYYSAQVYLYAVEQKENIDSKFSDSIRAIVFYIGSTKATNFDDVKKWIPHLKNIEAEVQLLICNSSDESNEDDKKSILNWCVQNQYELVELNSNSDSDDEGECDIKDVKGYERVVQSLQSYPWANLIMKDEQHERNVSQKEENIEGNKEATEGAEGGIVPKNVGAESSQTAIKKISVDNKEVELEEQWVNNVLNGEDPGGESFEVLFEKFASMKDKAAGLSGEDRKKYAEKVAIAFWRAMGGDEEEIDGLDDD